MRSPIRKGDKPENGGEVIGDSPTMYFMGKSVARRGDAVLCAVHGNTTIAEGNPSFRDQDGRPVALHQHRCACGCRLISSLSHVHIA